MKSSVTISHLLIVKLLNNEDQKSILEVSKSPFPKGRSSGNYKKSETAFLEADDVKNLKPLRKLSGDESNCLYSCLSDIS